MLWAVAVWIAGGFAIVLPGMTIQSHDPLRPLAAGALAAIVYAVTRGPFNPHRLGVPLAVLLSLCAAATGIARNSWTAGGSDSFAYVSQADLWLKRSLSVPVPLASTVPWPDAVWTFSPHGFKPAVGEIAIVSVTAPGLPLLMAGAKAIAGHCAMFLVTPLCGALLVWLTFVIGRRIDSNALGLVAAWLVATSPAVLAMLVSPMSDVPAAAFWALAVYFTLGETTRSAWLAGIASSVAILVRPNLAPLAFLLIAWRTWVWEKTGGVAGTASIVWHRQPAVLIAAGTVPGCLFIAWVNHVLYGSPLASGYGPLVSLFSPWNVFTNFGRYGRWLMESQTPIAALGVAALLLPVPQIWRTIAQRRAAVLLGSLLVTVWLLYLIYTPYDAWWFLRFLLPAWPAMCLGAGALLLRLAQTQSLWLRFAAVVLTVGVGLYGLRFATRNGAFPSGEGDHRYASIAKMVEEVTEPSAVVFAGQNSGPVRYYAGRTIVRFDLLHPEWLDRAVQSLAQLGHRAYFLLEDSEVPEFRRRFATANALGAVALAPVISYRAPGVPGTILLFDPANPDGGRLMTTPPASARAKCVAPSPLLH